MLEEKQSKEHQRQTENTVSTDEGFRANLKLALKVSCNSSDFWLHSCK